MQEKLRILISLLLGSDRLFLFTLPLFCIYSIARTENRHFRYPYLLPRCGLLSIRCKWFLGPCRRQQAMYATLLDEKSLIERFDDVSINRSEADALKMMNNVTHKHTLHLWPLAVDQKTHIEKKWVEKYGI